MSTKKKTTPAKKATTRKRKTTKPKKQQEEKLTVEHKGRYDWEANNFLITQEWLEFLKANKRPPTFKHLAEATGLSYITVFRHMNDERTLKIREQMKEYSVLVPDMMAAIFRAGMSGKPQSQKLFMEVTGAYIPKMAQTDPEGEALQPIVGSDITIINKHTGPRISSKTKTTVKAKSRKTNRDKLKDLEKGK